MFCYSTKGTVFCRDVAENIKEAMVYFSVECYWLKLVWVLLDVEQSQHEHQLNSVRLVLFETRASLISINFTIILFLNLLCQFLLLYPLPTKLSYLLFYWGEVLFLSSTFLFFHCPCLFLLSFHLFLSPLSSTLSVQHLSTGDSKIPEALLQQHTSVLVEALHYCTVLSTHFMDTHTHLEGSYN